MKYYILYFTGFAMLLHIIYWGTTMVVIPFILRKKARKWLDSPHKIKSYAIFSDLYRGVKARKIARREHRRLGLNDDIFTYGEIEFIDFAKLLSVVNPKPGEIFVDLGSGSGKAVFAAALLYPLILAKGIELLPALYQLSEHLMTRFQVLVSEAQDSCADDYNIEFIHDDILQSDYQVATIVFANATCYPEAFLDAVIKQLDTLAEGSRVILISGDIFSANYTCLYEAVHLMSWGRALCRVYIKTK